MFLSLFYFALLLGVAPAIIILVWGGKLSSKTLFLKPFALLTILATLYELIFSWILSIDSSIWFRIYIFIEFSALFYFYYKLLQKKEYLFFFVVCAAAFFFIYSLSFYSLGKTFKDYDSTLTVIETIFVYLGSLLWFKDMFETLGDKSILVSPAFYFISGLLIYFSGTVFLFLFSDAIEGLSKPTFKEYWCLNVFFTIVLRIFIIIGLWKGKQMFIRYSG